MYDSIFSYLEFCKNWYIVIQFYKTTFIEHKKHFPRNYRTKKKKI